MGSKAKYVGGYTANRNEDRNFEKITGRRHCVFQKVEWDFFWMDKSSITLIKPQSSVHGVLET